MSTKPINPSNHIRGLLAAGGGQPFRYCRPHYVYLYELQPPISLKYFRFSHCFRTLSRGVFFADTFRSFVSQLYENSP